jgi:hypothetical protein
MRNGTIKILVFVICILLSACVEDNPETPPPTPTIDQTIFSSTANTATPIVNVQVSPQVILPTSTNLVLPPPPLSRIVRLAWFMRPPEKLEELGYLAKTYDLFILTGEKDEPTRDWLYQNGVTTPIVQYLRSEAIMDPNGCTELPWGNNVAYKKGDFCEISQQHPDWFLLDVTGKRIHDNEGFYRMDPGNPQWRNFWLERAIEMQQQKGWQGVFLDNLDASLGRYKVMLANYSDNASFTNAVEDFLAYISVNYFQPKYMPLYANILYVEDPDVWFRYLRYLNGAMVEAWGVGWGSEYLAPEEWEKHMALAENTQKMNKEIILVAQGDEYDIEKQKFSFASYLLISMGKAIFRYTNYDNYGEVWKYPNYGIDLGQPLSPRYQQDNHTWRRDFSKGYVTVDPINHQSEIILSQ